MAKTQESIEITFDTIYHPPSPGSSAWSMTATNIRLVLMVHFFGSRFFIVRLRGAVSEPYRAIQQYIILQRISASEYAGEALIPLHIKDGSDGQTRSYKQFLGFDRLYTDTDFSEDDPEALPREPLTDPVSQSGTFQIDMFAASPFAGVDMGMWGSMA